MKTLCLALSLMLASNAFATGGFYCFNKDKSLEISGTTGRLYGNPIVDSVYLTNNGTESVFKKINAVGYWNMGNDLKLAVIDNDFMDMEFVLEAKKSLFSHYFVGKVTLKDDSKVRVKCEME